MCSINSIWKLIATLGLAFGLPAASLHAADGGAHKHEHAAVAGKPALNEGKRWATDEALRNGMSNIRNAMEASLHEIHEGKFSNAKYGELAKKVGDEVGVVVSNCKLEPQADAQLHLVIADLLDGAEAMSGKVKKVARQSGAVKVLGALDKYATYFDHPDWKPIAH